MTIKFTAEIVPVPLARSRINFNTKKIYYPKRSKEFKEWLKSKLIAVIDLYKNCKIDSRCYGDVDNHQKAILDALNKICYDDDCQIVKVICEKHKDKNQRIEIQIEEDFSDD